MREVLFYRTAGDHCPVEEFLDSLSTKQAQKVVWVLRLLEELDSVPRQYLKRLEGTEALWEIRAQHGGDTFRLLGFFDGSAFIVTSGFAKKTDKVPRQEIWVADGRRREHLKRRKK